MDIIKYGNLYKNQKKIKAKCSHCGTKVAMIRSDYQLDYQADMIWTCPYCENIVRTKKFSIRKAWRQVRDWFEEHECLTVTVFTTGFCAAFVGIPILIVALSISPDSTDRYYLEFRCASGSYQEYIDDYELEGDTLYTWDNGEKMTYMKATITQVKDLEGEE